MLNNSFPQSWTIWQAFETLLIKIPNQESCMQFYGVVCAGGKCLSRGCLVCIERVCSDLDGWIENYWPEHWSERDHSLSGFMINAKGWLKVVSIEEHVFP